MHEITLRAMQFHALVGILPHERISAQPIEVDLRVGVDLGGPTRSGEAGGTSAHPGVIDYRGLYDLVAAVLNAGPIDFLEEICDRVADRALAHSARIRSVRVAVRKPHVSLGGPLAYAEVAVDRTRG